MNEPSKNEVTALERMLAVFLHAARSPSRDRNPPKLHVALADCVPRVYLSTTAASPSTDTSSSQPVPSTRRLVESKSTHLTASALAVQASTSPFNRSDWVLHDVAAGTDR